MLLIPGPVDVPEIVLKASAYVQNHRSEEFKSIVRNSKEILDRISDSSYSIMTTGSGTTAVESIIYSMIAPGEKVLAVSFGEFGNRMIESLERRGAIPISIRKSEHDVMERDEIGDVLTKERDVRSVFLVHNETGNGTQLNNVQELAEEANSFGMKVFVDSVSGFGATEIKANSWGIHAFASCSQKGLASVPGLGIVCIGEEGLKFILEDKNMPSYLDLKNSLRFMDKYETPYTPSTGSFRALLVALRILEKEGISRRWLRHQKTAEFVRKELKLVGLYPYGREENFSNSVVAFKPPMSSSELSGKLRKRNIIVSRGIGKEADQMIRLGLLGVVDGHKISEFLSVLMEILGSDRRISPEELPQETFIDPETYDVDCF